MDSSTCSPKRLRYSAQSRVLTRTLKAYTENLCPRPFPQPDSRRPPMECLTDSFALDDSSASEIPAIQGYELTLWWLPPFPDRKPSPGHAIVGIPKPANYGCSNSRT